MPNVDHPGMLDAVPTGVVLHDDGGRIIYANTAACTLLGLDRETLTSLSSHDAWEISAADGTPVAPAEQPAMIALRTGERVDDVALKVARPDGAFVWLLVTAVPLATDAGRQVVVTFNDATKERERFEAARRAQVHSERLYESVLRAMSEGLVIHAPNGAIEFCNAGAERILGLSREQMRGRDAIDPRWRLVRFDGTPVTQSEIPSERTARTGRAAHAVLGVERPDGRRAWLSVSSDSIVDEDDTLHGVVATFTDITPLREAQLAQESAIARQAAITAAMPGVIFQFEAAGDGAVHFPYLGGQVEELTGLPAGALSLDPRRLAARMSAADVPPVLEALERSRANLTTFDQLIRLTSAASPRWLRVRAEPERMGTATRWTGVALDVSDEQNLAEALRRSQRREAMGDLAGGLAHNFNNMLAVILPNLEAARESAPGAEEYLADAHTATVRASELVKQLLQLARGTTRATREDADLVTVIRDVTSLCRRTFGSSIELKTRIAPALALTPGNLSHLEQVVLNLCLNARDALVGREGPCIELHLVEVAEPLGEAASHYRLTVRDNGCGMTRDVLARVGEPFFTTKPPGQGTGLGLATVFGSLRDLGGSVEVASELGQGTTFVLRCPASAGARATERPAVSSAPAPARRILVVDDEALVRTGLLRALKPSGHVVFEAPSGGAALRLLDEGLEVDLVLLDLSMPGLPGAEALRRIRAHDPTLPIIVLSGDAPALDTLPHAAEVLEKPVERAALLAAVQRGARPSRGR